MPRKRRFALELLTLDLAPPIAVGGTADIHDWRDGRVLKLFHADVPRRVAEREARMTQLLHAAGARVPAVGEALEVNGRLGLPMQKLSGQPLAQRFADAESGRRAGSLAAEVHAALHALTAPALIAMREQFRRVIEAGALASEVKQRTLRTLDALPDGDRICHGDFHAANIMITDEGPFVIDCVVAHRGNPLADVAQTWVAMTEWLYGDLAPPIKRAVESFIDAYMRRYIELSRASRADVEVWKPVVAAVRYGFPHPPSSDALLLRLIG